MSSGAIEETPGTEAPDQQHTITLLRHGHAWNNMISGFPCRDPILTERGRSQAAAVRLSRPPDLIVVSPLTRTLETAIIAFGHLFRDPNGPNSIPVQVWPDLRECGDRPFNQSRTRAQLEARYPFLDFSECSRSGLYGDYNERRGHRRARRVRRRLMELSRTYGHIVVVSHQGFIHRLNGGSGRYRNCECWSYRVGVDFSITGDGELAPPTGSGGPTQVAAGEESEVDESS
ncbi:hypothetical protein VM1G_02203 [Cytospora mali]|uniref:Sedoheptulose 1,7-bisphosphatase n=1 Tax=Cytospora mali TaxID=578113 RepID=A0A194VR40_CYTMA|nr:hypothetical protein VM1G_02203 [Valsa mali]